MVFISIIVYVIVILHIMLVNGNPNVSGGGGSGVGGEKNKNDLLTQLVDKLTNAKTIAQNSVNAIYKEWEVDKYPNFLKSCFMNKISWELLSLKYQKKIMEAYLFKDKKSVFVMSFTGSSVTAGHDSHFNYSTPIVTGDLMRASLAAMDVMLDSRNVALGNNPCTPYDMCVKFFVGLDADIVHWEQTYFCGGKGPLLEQFIRQASTIPAMPIVVFSDSNTGHWRKDECDKPGRPTSHTVDPSEKELLDSAPLQLVSELNKDEFHRVFGQFDPYTRLYHFSGVQTFHHLSHDKYACLGPYIPTWMKGAASWHPSIIGHRLRASHHAYFWLLIWIDAIDTIIDSISKHHNLDVFLKHISNHLEKLGHVKLETPIHESIFPDNAKCYTDYEPRMVRESSLKSKVIHGLISADQEANTDAKGWKFLIYEMIVKPDLVANSYRQGYHDFKHLMYGDESSGPLSIDASTDRAGPIILCETPGIWGSLPGGFQHFWTEGVADVFVTFDVKDIKSFVFQPKQAKKMQLYHEKELEICAQLFYSTDENPKEKIFPVGSHVLTIAAKSTTKMILAWMITA